MIKIGIIGSGISGLYTAYKLYKKYNTQIEIVIYEKNNYIGGRVLTHPEFGYEIGAGRFGLKHKLLMTLIKDLQLDNNIKKISNEIKYTDKNTQKIGENHFYKYFNQLQKEKHKNNDLTIKDNLGNSDLFKQLIKYYEYNGDITNYSLNYFVKYITKTQDTYNVLIGGLSQVIHKLTNFILQSGGKIKTNITVSNLEYLDDKNKFCINKSDWYDKVIFTVPPTKNIKLSHNLYNLYNLNKLIKPEPLYRIYAKYPNGWFKDIGKVVTNSKIKYIIPINSEHGLVMISYTDGDDAKKLKKIGTEKQINKFIHQEITRLFPDIEIPKPLWINHHYWNIGSYYWHQVPLKEVKYLVPNIVHPLDIDLYIIGDTFSDNQAWIEGALETSEILLKKFKL